MFLRLFIKLAAAALLFPIGAMAQETGRTYTDADYAQAEKFMSYNVDPLVYHAVSEPHWMPDTRFWYRDAGPKGETYIVVDPVKETKRPAFDQAKLATALEPFSKQPAGSIPSSSCRIFACG